MTDEPKFHIALTERQREVVISALTFIDPDKIGRFTRGELIDALGKFTNVLPESRVEHIPVLLNVGDQNPIGFGTIAGNKLFVQVDNEQVVTQVAHLARVGDIREIFLGLTFSINSVSAERKDRLTRMIGLKANGLSNAEIGEALGLRESVVRTILEGE